MKTKIYKFLILMLSSIIIASTSLFPVSAAQNSSNTYKLSISRPSTGSSTGYAEVLLKDSSGNPYVRVFAWNIYQVVISANSVSDYITSIPININLSSSLNSITFKIGPLTGISGTFFADIYSMNNGQTYYYQRLNGTSESWTFSGDILSMHVYGNYSLNGAHESLSETEFYVLYSDNGPIYNAIVGGQQDQTNQILQGQENQTDELIQGQENQTDDLLQGQQEQTNAIKSNQDKNTNKVLNAGSDVDQPDFEGTNSALNGTVNSIESIEGNYQIDQTATTSALNQGIQFMSGSQMLNASLQVKSWIERFTSENVVITGFLISAMVLGLCFWVIGRKSFG